MKGLLLQGAGFDKEGEKLVDNLNDAPEFSELPTTYLAWIDANQEDPYPSALTIVRILLKDVPLYFNGERERVITTLRMQNHGDPNDRIFAGTALFMTSEI